jgi:hypothetical protein
MFGVAALATPASASFDHHFSVLSKSTSQSRNGNVSRFRDKLLDPRNRDNRVGSDRGRCEFRQRAQKLEIGGNGHIRIRGDLEPHDNRLNVVGGDGDFDGAAGKVLLHDVNRRVDRLHFDLVR